jgi:ribonuclease HI
MPKNHFYVVWAGHKTGIFHSWEDCKKQVWEYPQAKYKGFATEAEAKQAFLSSHTAYIVKKEDVAQTPQNAELLAEVGAPEWESLAVDASCLGNPGIMEYRGVYARNGKEIFHSEVFEEGTNNIGEFLAIVHGLALLKQKNSSLPIYSDSRTAISWVRQKKAKTKLEKNEKNAHLFELITRAEKWLQANTYTTKIMKWHTEVWCEIPADFGRK